MNLKTFAKQLSRTLTFVVAICAVGCESQTQNVAVDKTVYSGTSTTPSSKDSAGTGPTICFINGVALHASDLQEPLYEEAGGQILSEVITDRLIAQTLEQKKLKVTNELLEKEKQQVLENLSADPDQSQKLLVTLRERRGLGETRFKNLLLRNAGLRLLVQDRVVIPTKSVDDEFMFAFGPRCELRLIVVQDLVAASTVIRRVKAGESFSDVAVQMSMDTSKAQGGLLSPISSVDDTYPQAIRTAMEKLKPGEVSDPIALPKSFAIIKLERRIEYDMPKFEKVKTMLEQRVRIKIERMMMEQEARTMIRKAELTVLNPALNKSWELQRQRLLQSP